MIEKQTVLVLGAGASMPYGFPSGSELRRLIVDGLDIERSPGRIPSQLFNALNEAGFSRKRMTEFRKELLAADTTSIDLFLERRTEFLDIGKAAIASVLIPRESEQTLFQTWKEPQSERADQAWYQYFASTLDLNFGNLDFHRLTILTYNYDRSLDHYLCTVLKATCQQSPEQCWEKLQTIQIIHLHGELGRYDPFDKRFLPYGSPLNGRVLKRAAAGIKIVHEVKEKKRFMAANAALDNAEIVCFLGFGYASENMSRLRIKANTIGQQIMGTAYRLTDAEQRRLKLGAYLDKPFPSDWDVLRSLRESNVLG
jgi:hypothetical protein